MGRLLRFCRVSIAKRDNNADFLSRAETIVQMPGVGVFCSWRGIEMMDGFIVVFLLDGRQGWVVVVSSFFQRDWG